MAAGGATQQKKKKNKREESAQKKHVRGSPFPQHDKGVVASRSLQSKGRGNGHCSTQGSQLLSEMATNGVGGRWQHVRGNEASLQHTCIIERQIKGQAFLSPIPKFHLLPLSCSTDKKHAGSSLEVAGLLFFLPCAAHHWLKKNGLGRATAVVVERGGRCADSTDGWKKRRRNWCGEALCWLVEGEASQCAAPQLPHQSLEALL